MFTDEEQLQLFVSKCPHFDHSVDLLKGSDCFFFSINHIESDAPFAKFSGHAHLTVGTVQRCGTDVVKPIGKTFDFSE